jgi:hypothetical protein
MLCHLLDNQVKFNQSLGSSKTEKSTEKICHCLQFTTQHLFVNCVHAQSSGLR